MQIVILIKGLLYFSRNKINLGSPSPTCVFFMCFYKENVFSRKNNINISSFFMFCENKVAVAAAALVGGRRTAATATLFSQMLIFPGFQQHFSSTWRRAGSGDFH